MPHGSAPCSPRHSSMSNLPAPESVSAVPPSPRQPQQQQNVFFPFLPPASPRQVSRGRSRGGGCPHGQSPAQPGCSPARSRKASVGTPSSPHRQSRVSFGYSTMEVGTQKISLWTVFISIEMHCRKVVNVISKSLRNRSEDKLIASREGY